MFSLISFEERYQLIQHIVPYQQKLYSIRGAGHWEPGLLKLLRVPQNGSNSLTYDQDALSSFMIRERGRDVWRDVYAEIINFNANPKQSLNIPVRAVKTTIN